MNHQPSPIDEENKSETEAEIKASSVHPTTPEPWSKWKSLIDLFCFLFFFSIGIIGYVLYSVKYQEEIVDIKIIQAEDNLSKMYPIPSASRSLSDVEVFSVPTDLPTMAPSITPLFRAAGKWQYCDPYHPFVGEQVSCFVEACPGDLLTISLCQNDNGGRGGRVYGDTYLWLLDATTRKTLAENDDSCGLVSRIEYLVGEGAICQQYEIAQGCYENSNCLGRVGVLLTAGAQLTPTVQPSSPSASSLHIPRMLDNWQVSPEFRFKGIWGPTDVTTTYTMTLCPSDYVIISQCPADYRLISAPSSYVTISLSDQGSNEILFSRETADSSYSCGFGGAASSRLSGNSLNGTCSDVNMVIKCRYDSCGGSVGIYLSENPFPNPFRNVPRRIPRELDKWIVTDEFHMPTSLEILGGRVTFQVELCYGDTITFSAGEKHEPSLYTNSWFDVIGVGSDSFYQFSNSIDFTIRRAASSLILHSGCQIYNVSMRCERCASSGCNGRIGVRIEESDASNTTVITSSNKWEVCGSISLGEGGGNKLRVCELTVCPSESVMISFCRSDDARFFRAGDPDDYQVQLSREVGESYEPVYVYGGPIFQVNNTDNCTRFVFTHQFFPDQCGSYGVDFSTGSETSAVMGINHLIAPYLPRVPDQWQYCDPFYVALTPDGIGNSPTCVVEVCPGDRLDVTMCQDDDTQPVCSGRTYLRLFNENMVELGELYNGCGRTMDARCRTLKTDVSVVSCVKFTIRENCWGNYPCSGTVRVLVSGPPTTAPTDAPTLAPTIKVLSNAPGEWLFCPSLTTYYWQDRETSSCYLEACPGDILTISLCTNDNPGIVSWGDPYLKLMDITTREEIADSDDSCGLAPRIEYAVGGEDCRRFEVVEGCAVEENCITRIGVLVTAANSTPTAQPTAHSPADLHLPRLLDTWQVTPSYFSKGGKFDKRYTVALCPGDRFILSQCLADSPLIEAATGSTDAIRLFDQQTGRELFSLLYSQSGYACDDGWAGASKYVGSSCADVELRVESSSTNEGCAGNVGVFVSESDLFTGGEYSLGRIPRALDRWIVTEEFHQLTTREILSPVSLEVELCPGDTVTFSACDRYEDSLYLAGAFFVYFPYPFMWLVSGCGGLDTAPSIMTLTPSCQNHSITLDCYGYTTDIFGSVSVPSGCHGRVGIYIGEQAGDPVVIESINQWEVCGNISLPDGGVKLRVCEMDLCPGDSLEVSFCSLDDPRFFMNGSDYLVRLGQSSNFNYESTYTYLSNDDRNGCRRATLSSINIYLCFTFGIDFSSSTPTTAVMGVRRVVPVPTRRPTRIPSRVPTKIPTHIPTVAPSIVPTTSLPSHRPTGSPISPTASPSAPPTTQPSYSPVATQSPTENPSQLPSFVPSRPSTLLPTAVLPSVLPSKEPTLPRPATARPSLIPSQPPTTGVPSFAPTAALTQIQGSFSLDNMNLRDMSAEEVSVLQTSLRESIAATTNVNETAIKNLTLSDGGAGAGGRRSLSSSPRLLVSFLVGELSSRLHDDLVSSNHTSSGAGSGGCGGPASSSLVDLFQSLLSCGGGSALLDELKSSIAENLGQVNGTGGASSLLQAVQSATIGSVVVVDRTPTASPTRLPSLVPEDGAGSSSSGEGMMLALEIAIPVAGFVLVALVVGLAYRCLRGPSSMKVIPVPAVSAPSSSAPVSSDRYHVTHDHNNIRDDGQAAASQQDSGVTLFSP